MLPYNRRVSFLSRKPPLLSLVPFAVLALSGCASVRYYAHVAHGEVELLAARRPIERVLADPAVDGRLKQRLQRAARARAFASDRLGLPRNASYASYADLHRPYATWNVYAAPEFSVEASTQCYLLVGCLAYRGYFDKARAESAAARLAANGLDTWVGGSAAYSTLGWFDDPILNTMLRWDDDELAGTIFHELAHQRLFAKGDTEFNESFATFVQDEGLREWHAALGLPPRDDAGEQRSRQFESLVLEARERLRGVYASALPPDAMRARKREEIERLRRDYYEMRDGEWAGHGDFDAWIAAPINNAKLLPFGLYRRWQSAFAALFERNGKDWNGFYDAARNIARLDAAARNSALQELQPSAP
jgi:predicted aminopeptidase